MIVIEEKFNTYEEVLRYKKTAKMVFGKLDYAYDFDVTLINTDSFAYYPGAEAVKYKVVVKQYGLQKKSRL